MLLALIMMIFMIGLPVAFWRNREQVEEFRDLGYAVDSYVVVREGIDAGVTLTYQGPTYEEERLIPNAMRTRLRLVNTGHMEIRKQDVRKGSIGFRFPGSQLIGNDSTIVVSASDDGVEPKAELKDSCLAISFERLREGDWLEADFLHEGNGAKPRHPPVGHVQGMPYGEIQELSFFRVSPSRRPSLRSEWKWASGLLVAILLFVTVAYGLGLRSTREQSSEPSGRLQQYVLTVHGPLEQEIALGTPEVIELQPQLFGPFVFERREANGQWNHEFQFQEGWYGIVFREVTTNISGPNKCRHILEVVEPDTIYDLKFLTNGDVCGGSIELEVRKNAYQSD